MERIFTSGFSMFPKNDGLYEVLHCEKKYKISHKKSGPAFTLIITTPEGSKIDVDLVPCLEFDNVPLGNGYKSLNGSRKTWMAVAKPLSSLTDDNKFWRLCFYEQEREFLPGDIKPVIRMMKKFRDSMKWKSIASYFIETIFYHEIENRQSEMNAFLKAPKICLFMLGMKNLMNYMEKKELPYFWHQKHNLFGKIHPYELEGYTNKLKKIILKTDNTIMSDRYILADIVLTAAEASIIKNGLQENTDCESQTASTPETAPYSICTIN